MDLPEAGSTRSRLDRDRAYFRRRLPEAFAVDLPDDFFVWRIVASGCE